MIVILVVVALIALDVLALKFGADSRYGVERDPKLIGIVR